MDFVLIASMFSVPVPRVVLAAAGVSPSQISMIVIIAAISVMMLVLTRRRIREGRNSPRAYAREQIARLREEREVQNQVQGVMVELEQLSRQINAQVDTRFAKLQAVIRDADGRIDALTRLVHAAEGKPRIDVTVGDESSSPPSDDVREQSRNQIYALADAGHNPTEIARKAGQTPGEVELILALRQGVTAETPSRRGSAC